MNEHERIRVAVIVAAFSLVMGIGGGVAASQGGALVGLLGFALIVFAVMGFGQAAAIGLGYLEPGGATGDVDERDARDE